jgi:hypothetical protein
MSSILVGLVAVIYAAVALNQLSQKNYADCVIWTGYVLANIGFIWKYSQ